MGKSNPSNGHLMMWMRERVGLFAPVCFTAQTISHNRQPVHFVWSITSIFSI
jgi:hypothetical protein